MGRNLAPAVIGRGFCPPKAMDVFRHFINGAATFADPAGPYRHERHDGLTHLLRRPAYAETAGWANRHVAAAE